MDPVITKILQGIPYSGMGSTLERNALIGVIRNLIEQNKYTVEYIISYCESVGYQRQMAEDVFKELTGLSPKLIVNNNEYYNCPSYLPCYSIAWGYSKTKPNFVNFVKPYSYGYAVFEKNEIDAPVEVITCATIPEAINELKKVAKGIQTLDKIITKKLLETEDIPTIAENPHQVNKPYAASPLQILKKNFKDKVLSVSEFERQASKLLASEEITVDEAEDLMAWKQDLIDEDETYGNDVLELDEQWKPLNAEVDDDDFNGYHSSEEYLNSYEHLYETLVTGNIDLYKEKLNKLSKTELMDYIAWAEEMGIGREELKLHYITASKKQSGIVPTEKITLEDGRTFTVRYNPNEKSITTILDENGREIGVDTGTRLQLLRKLFHKGEPTIVESKKKNAGYSNNPDYFGDWFGKGQIDYSKIINPEDSGKVFMLKIWGGSGYILDVYLVKANDYEDAIDKVFEWSYENEGANKIIFDYGYLSERCHEDYESEYFYGREEGKPSDKMSYEDFETEWLSDWVNNSDYNLFARAENFFIDELPEEYTNKKQSSKKKAYKNVPPYSEKERDRILNKFQQEYDFLYEHDDNVAGYDEAVDAYEQYRHNTHFMGLVVDLVRKRGDAFSSDREVGALMFALDSLGYLDEIDAMTNFKEPNASKKASLKKKALYIPEDDAIIDNAINDGWPKEMVLATYQYLLRRTGKEKKVNDELIAKVTQFINDFGGFKSEETMYNNETLEELATQLGFKKEASKKVTAENMTLDDIEAEDNKDTVQEEIDKINEKPAEEVFSETTPEQYFEDALAEDKVDTINEVVSKCIDKFSEKFKDFDKYTVEILSYNTKVLGDYKPNTEEMVEDKELNANAILQVILSITNNADETNVKKALAVFSITNGELHWTGTVRGENDQVVAFTEEGLDSFFEVEDIKEDEIEDII